MSYDTERGYRKLKGRDRSFVFSKDKNKGFLDKVVKIKTEIPSVGAYDLTKADKIISKGLNHSMRVS